MSENSVIHYSQRFDEALGLVPHYQSYPRMRPFVGTEYGKHGPKILLIAESHYLPAKSTVHLDAKQWYAGTEADITAEDGLGWIHTRGILNKNAGAWRRKGHTIYRRLEQALVEAGLPASDNTFKYVAFMNGFQRPAVSKLSIEPEVEDIEISSHTVTSVIDTLKPDHVIFVSSKAKKLLGKHLNVQSHVVPHPACAWWYKASKKGTGRSQFVSLVTGFLNTYQCRQ